MSSPDQLIELQKLSEQIKKCSLCRLGTSRINAVPGEGNLQTEIVFVGEGPGKNEDEQGIPFCGASGKFLEELLASINLTRQDVFITNVVKCRPPANRDPLPDEKSVCSSTYLDKQITLIAPKLIVTLGRHALNHFIPDLKISAVHGKPKRYKGQVYLALYHPAVALYNASMRETLKEDFILIPKILRKINQES